MRCNGGGFACTVAGLLALASVSRAEFSFQTIDDLDSDLLRISGDAATVVGEAGGRPALWTRATGSLGLGDFPGGDANGGAFGVSFGGDVIVGNVGSASGVEAFRWTADGGMVGLGDLAGAGPVASAALGVSGDGAVIVGHSSRAWPILRAFRWTAATGMVDLGSLPGGDGFALAHAVTPDGQIVVGGSRTAAREEAFRWSEATGMVALGVVPGAFSSRALAVSADGGVVVGIGAGPSGFEAFRWTAESGMVGLGSLDPSDFASSASGVSADGSVIVGIGSGAADFNGEAFVWFPGTGMLNLRDYLVTNGVAPAQGWRLIEAADVSADGRTLVGTGLDPQGQRRVWIARIEIDETPPPAPTPSPTPTPGPGQPETIAPVSLSLVSGRLLSGGVAQLRSSDDDPLRLDSAGVKKIQLTVSARAARSDVSELRFAAETSATAPRSRREIALFDYVRRRWVTLDRRTASEADTIAEVRTTNRPSRFLEPGTLRIQARLTFTARRTAVNEARIDQVVWTRIP
jgi:probable HAF family extracellular repeat protein